MKKIILVIAFITLQIKLTTGQPNKYTLSTTGVAYSEASIDSITIAGVKFDETINKMIKFLNPVKIESCDIKITRESYMGISVTYEATLVKCTQAEAIDTLIRIGYVSFEIPKISGRESIKHELNKKFSVTENRIFKNLSTRWTKEEIKIGQIFYICKKL
ncbi:MAG TPA: hypothetical protein PK886_01510 [Candidatus Paceibacterota bacterium]|nr:hypothetical protein [Candidatus Paceibacterota bacterium]